MRWFSSSRALATNLVDPALRLVHLGLSFPEASQAGKRSVIAHHPDTINRVGRGLLTGSDGAPGQEVGAGAPAEGRRTRLRRRRPRPARSAPGAAVRRRMSTTVRPRQMPSETSTSTWRSMRADELRADHVRHGERVVHGAASVVVGLAVEGAVEVEHRGDGLSDRAPGREARRRARASGRLGS